MELKLYFGDDYEVQKCLLIVPYGIEMIQNQRNDLFRLRLLIVPYGIEICLVMQI